MAARFTTTLPSRQRALVETPARQLARVEHELISGGADRGDALRGLAAQDAEGEIRGAGALVAEADHAPPHDPVPHQGLGKSVDRRSRGGRDRVQALRPGVGPTAPIAQNRAEEHDGVGRQGRQHLAQPLERQPLHVGSLEPFLGPREVAPDVLDEDAVLSGDSPHDDEPARGRMQAPGRRHRAGGVDGHPHACDRRPGLEDGCPPRATPRRKRWDRREEIGAAVEGEPQPEGAERDDEFEVARAILVCKEGAQVPWY